MDLELVLFKACPYAQRVVITLLHHDIPHTRTHVMPAKRPEWLFDVTPSGSVPVLRVDGQTALGDSSAINEYLDEISGGGLIPKEPLARALCRSRIDLIGSVQSAFGRMTAAPEEEKYQQARIDFQKLLGFLESHIDAVGPYFSGGEMTGVDVALAPLFMRMEELLKSVHVYKPGDFPKLSALSETLLGLPVVQNSMDGNFSEIFRNSVRARGRGGYVDSLLG
ncbi:MAG: glutathione S-transferase family protein [Magnetococcales bacterium]|nr:glutathione S-transferase family protein [Magnetococcales bacterium]